MQRYFGRVLSTQVVLSEDDVFHLTHVMRAKAGEQIEVVADGLVYLAEVKKLRPLTIDVVKKIRENHELPNHVILVASLIKGEKMDFVLQKATELGVSEIVLLQTDRTVVKFKRDDKQVKLQRFNRILKEAAEQSKRSMIPALYRVIDLDHLKDVDANVKMIAYEGMEGTTTYLNKVVNSIKPGQKVSIMVGPEGGFTEHEVHIAENLGYKVVGLGRRILRSETACIYALSVIANYLESK